MPHNKDTPIDHEDASERDYVGEQIAELLDHAKAQRQRADDWNTPEDMEDGLRDTARVLEDAADMLAAIRGGTFGAPRSPTPIDPSDEQVERVGDAVHIARLHELQHDDAPNAVRPKIGRSIIEWAGQEITALRSPVPRELREALEALEPFARRAAEFDGERERIGIMRASDGIYDWDEDVEPIELGDLRRAKRAYDHLIQKERSQ